MSDPSVPLDKHIDTRLEEMDRRHGQRFDAQEKAVSAALAAAEKAVQAALAASDRAITKSEANDEKWRANSNEWRGAMDDREIKLLSKAEAEPRFENLRERDDAMDVRLRDLEQRVGGTAQRGQGVKDAWGYLVAAVVAAGGVVAIVVAFAR